MKKFILKLFTGFFALTMLFAVTSSTISAGESGSTGYMGPRSNLYGSYTTGYNLSGDWIKVILKGVGNEKRVFARMGSEGSYSTWAGATTASVSEDNYGSFGSIGGGNYSYRFYWR